MTVHGIKTQTSDVIPITVWDRVCSMPVIKSSTNVYLRSKGKSVLVGTGLEVIESGIRLASVPVKSVASSVAAAYPKKASRLECLAHDCLDQLEDKVPTLQHHAGEVVEGTSRTFKRGIRGVLKSYPGQKVLQGLNSSIDVAEQILESVQDAGIEGRKYCSKGTQFTPDDIRGSKGGESTSSQKSKRQTGLQTKRDKKASSVVILQVMKYPITIPLKIWIFILKGIKRALVAVAGRKHRSTTALLSPDRMAVIKNRKKVSPKKRVASTSPLQGLLRTIVYPVKVLFNAQPTKRDISLYIKPPEEGNLQNIAINGERHAEKRKHSDIDEDEEFSSTEETDEDIYGLDDYVSSDDSDFKPHNASTDSLEYASGDTESDIDTEEIGKNKKTGSPLRQIRKTPKARSKPSTQPALQETKDNNQNSQVKGDNMALIVMDSGKRLDLVGHDKNKEQNNKNKEQGNKNKEQGNNKA